MTVTKEETINVAFKYSKAKWKIIKEHALRNDISAVEVVRVLLDDFVDLDEELKEMIMVGDEY